MASRLISASGREAIDLLNPSISILDNLFPGSPMCSVVSLSASSVSPWHTFFSTKTASLLLQGGLVVALLA
eukprot:75281-Pyramimonas_sp.AAC.1